MPVPLIAPSSTQATGWSFQQYRRRLARELGQFGIMTVTSTPETGTTVDAARQILCTELARDNKLPTRYDNFWVYVVDGVQAGSVRQVWEGSYDGAVGSLLLDQPFSAPLASGTEIELCDTLPAVSYGTVDGMRECLTLGLEALPVEDRVSISAVTNQLEYGFQNYPWPIKRLTDVFAPLESGRVDAETPERRTRHGWSFVNDADTPLLVLASGYETGQTFRVALHRPASTWIRSAGVWGDSTVGLVAEDDQALYEVGTVVREALPIAHRRLANLHAIGTPERAEHQGLAEQTRHGAAIAKLFSRFRGTGAQRVGAVGGR